MKTARRLFIEAFAQQLGKSAAQIVAVLALAFFLFISR
jgi:hypothetical protein